MKLKLFPKFALILISLATVPVIVVGWQTATVNREHLETNILELHTNLANSLSNRIDLSLSGLDGRMRAVIDPLRRQGFISEDPLRTLINANGELISIAYLNERGRELVRVERAGAQDQKKLIDHAEDPLFLIFQSQRSNPGNVKNFV